MKLLVAFICIVTINVVSSVVITKMSTLANKTFLSYENKFVTFMYRYGTIVLFVFLFTPIFDIIYSFFTTNILLGFIAFWGLFI